MCNSLNISTDNHGFILIDGSGNNPMARTLTTLLAYLVAIFEKYTIEESKELALKVILEGKIEGHFVNIFIPPQFKEKGGEKEKVWKIPSDLIHMNRFFIEKMSA